jgi:hypothetical protein
MTDLSAAMVSICGAKLETYDPAALNWPGPFVPSPPNLRLLALLSELAGHGLGGRGRWVGKNTMSASLGTFVT